jgi:hypothetical protein
MSTSVYTIYAGARKAAVFWAKYVNFCLRNYAEDYLLIGSRLLCIILFELHLLIRRIIRSMHHEIR